jgi:galactoside O-acetyltransferase
VNIIEGPIILEKYVNIGTNSAVLPNVTLKEGSVLGSFSLLTKNTEEWSINAGVTAKKIKLRKRGLLDLVKIMEDKWS